MPGSAGDAQPLSSVEGRRQRGRSSSQVVADAFATFNVKEVHQFHTHVSSRSATRAVIDLAQRGGGLGLFTGCATRNTAGALVFEVTGSLVECELMSTVTPSLRSPSRSGS